jgi:hypothetical protein
MAETTSIEWTDVTFNPWVGCTKISPACDHCYAEGWAKRAGNPELWQGERRRTIPRPRLARSPPPGRHRRRRGALLMETDQREGVSPAVHAMLDRVYGPKDYSLMLKNAALAEAVGLARGAADESRPTSERIHCAREAAARLLHALEMMDREAEGGQ